MLTTKDLVTQLATHCLTKQWTLTTAESCTGGMVAAAITALAGSSQWFERGYVTYSNDAKVQDIGVAENLIQEFGAVSREVALAMAEGAQVTSQSHVSLAITGIAGPTGGSEHKPVGTVWFAWKLPDQEATAAHQLFLGDRSSIRQQACDYALQHLIELLNHASTV